METQAISATPVHDRNVIHCEGCDYVVPFENDYEAQYSRTLGVHLDLEPGEVPRRVMEGFVYGGRAFLPEPDPGARTRASLEQRQRAQELVALDKARRRDASGARSIPVELEAEVYSRSRTQSARSIATWLRSEKNCTTTFASVGRLVRKMAMKEAISRQRDELDEEVASLRVQLRETFDTLMDLQADCLEGHADAQGRAIDPRSTPVREQLPVVWRMHHQNASLLERRLRGAERTLVTLQRRASGSRPPAVETPAAALPVRVENSPAVISPGPGMPDIDLRTLPYGVERAKYPGLSAEDWQSLERWAEEYGEAADANRQRAA